MMMTKTQREREEFPKRFRLCLLIITKKVRLLCVVVVVVVLILLLLFDHFLHLGVGGRIRRAGGIHDVHSPSNDVFEIGRVRGEERGHRDRDGEVHGEFKRLQRKGLCHSVSLFLSLSLSLSSHNTRKIFPLGINFTFVVHITAQTRRKFADSWYKLRYFVQSPVHFSYLSANERSARQYLQRSQSRR